MALSRIIMSSDQLDDIKDLWLGWRSFVWVGVIIRLSCELFFDNNGTQHAVQTA